MENQENEMVDLFDHMDLVPTEVLQLFVNVDDELSYQEISDIRNECESLGYTFDYYLDAEPFNLRKL